MVRRTSASADYRSQYEKNFGIFWRDMDKGRLTFREIHGNEAPVLLLRSKSDEQAFFSVVAKRPKITHAQEVLDTIRSLYGDFDLNSSASTESDVLSTTLYRAIEDRRNDVVLELLESGEITEAMLVDGMKMARQAGNLAAIPILEDYMQ